MLSCQAMAILTLIEMNWIDALNIKNNNYLDCEFGTGADVVSAVL